MGLFDRIFGRGRARAREARVQARGGEIRAALDRGAVDEARGLVRAALLDDPGAPELERLAADVLRHLGEGEAAELFARAADSPESVRQALELGSHLLTRDEPELAAAVLTRASTLDPFDAVLRSELALALSRSGRPEDVMAVLALHPNLGDDPGALFELAWAALLAGDVGTARGARDELAALRRTPQLLPKLDAALARAELAPAQSPPDARDYYFLEHGGLVLDASGPHRGRFAELALDRATETALLARAAWAIRELVVAPRRILHASQAGASRARALARAVDGTVAPLREHHGAGVLVVQNALELEALGDVLATDHRSVLTLALALDYRRTVAPAPDIVGVFVREPAFAAAFDDTAVLSPTADDALAAFAATRRPHLPPHARRELGAYVPDAPLPSP